MRKNVIPKDANMATLERHAQKVVTPSKLISLEKAVTYYNNFYNTRIAFNTTDKTRAVWFEFKMLEDYFERVTSFCAEKNIEITRFVFLLGAQHNGQRTVFLAPATYDEQLDLHRAFSFDNGEITYIHRFAGEDYSTVTELDDLQSVEQSLLLSNSGYLSSAKAITLYNNYFDTVMKPFSDIVDSDTRYVWYDKGEFEGYILYLKKMYNNLNGVNVIFGVKNNDEAEGIYANHLTLFFAPTISQCKDIQNFNEDLWEYPISKINSSSTTCFFNRGHGGPPPHSWD